MLTLVVVAIWYGRFAFLHQVTPPDYHYFGPAVMLATGQGFMAPFPEAGTPFGAFLSGEASALNASEAVAETVGAPDQFHHSIRYLLYVTAYWWRHTGISWAALADIAGALHALAALGVYFTARLFVPMPMALGAALWIAVSPWQLSMVAHVRDYSKGAFIVAALPLILLMALRVPARARFLVAAAAAGVVLGVGFGFRRDILVMIPITVACLVLCRGRWPWSDALSKLQGVATFLAAFLLVSAPVLVPLVQGGSHTMHVILLGHAPGFDRALGIDAPGYRALPFYDDGYAGMVVDAHNAAVGGAPILTNPSVEYDAAGQRLMLALLRHFPADIFVRALGAGNTILNMPFASPDPVFLTRPLPLADATARLHAGLYALNGLGGWLGAAFVVLATLAGLREGLLAGLLVLVLTGYSSLQFDLRHYFHLQVVPVIVLVVLAWAVMRGVVALVDRRGAVAPTGLRVVNRRRLAGHATAGVVVVLLLTAVPLSALRLYQGRHVTGLVEAYLRGPRIPVVTEPVALGQGATLLEWRDAPPEMHAGSGQRSAHYLAEFRGGQAPVTVAVRYRPNAAGVDFSRVIAVAPGEGTTRVGFQAFDLPGIAEFIGVEVGPEARDRLMGLYRVSDGGPAQLPLDISLPPDWTERRLYQRLRAEPADPRAFVPQQVVCAADHGCHGRLGAIEASTTLGRPPRQEDVRTIHAPSVQLTASGLAVDGRAESESAYLVEWHPVSFVQGGTLVWRGRLDEGGLLVGLLHDGRWHSQATVRTPGVFTIVVPVPAGGEYVPLMTNALPPGQRHIRFAITSMVSLPQAPVEEGR